MRNFRETAEVFAYSYLEYLIDLFDREGEDATLGDFKCKIDEGGFALGTMILCSVRLYLNEKDTERAEELKKRLLRLLDRIDDSTHIGTWGKQFVLEALVQLQDSGRLDIISKEKVELLREKTDYSDFFSRDEIAIPKGSTLPTNYYHVALACAAYREHLGFENDGMANRIAEKLIEIMKENSGDGWMDEVPPHGRFDSYSLGSYKHVHESLSLIGMGIPDFIMKNAKEAVLINYSARNRKGHGFSYGRSLSTYGDSGTMKHISFGLANGFFDEKDRDEALAYCIHLAERLTGFWYRKEENFFDIWTGTRSTDCYRGPEVVLNLNLEMCKVLLEAVEHLDSVGLADTVPKNDVSEPTKWESRKTVFVDEKDKKRALYVLRRGSHSFMLPFIGMSDRPNTVNDAYFAFPHEQEFIEEPVWRYQPFLVPEVTLDDETVAILMEGFESISEEYAEDKVKIKVSGKLVGRDTKPTDVGFDGEYIFDGDKITVEFNIHKPYKSAKMLFSGASVDHVRFIGSTSEEITDVSEDKEFRACSGGIKECKTACFNGKIGYEITL